MVNYHYLMGTVGTLVDAVGVLVIFFGAVYATIRFLVNRPPQDNRYRFYGQNIGRAILLGLEFLIAGDIIRTVVVSPSLENVAVLGGIVLIRTFLSTSLQLELEGKWPWQPALKNSK